MKWFIRSKRGEKTKRGKNIMKNKNNYKKKISGIVALTMMVFGCFAGTLMMTGCGTSDSEVAETESTVEAAAESTVDQTYEDQADENSSSSGVKARVEMDEYEYELESPIDVTLHGVINHSYGQDIVALVDGEEVARATLEGNNGDEERFKIVIPASAMTKQHNKVRIKGAELPGKVLETNTKLVSINIY